MKIKKLTRKCRFEGRNPIAKPYFIVTVTCDTDELDKIAEMARE